MGAREVDPKSPRELRRCARASRQLCASDCQRISMSSDPKDGDLPPVATLLEVCRLGNPVRRRSAHAVCRPTRPTSRRGWCCGFLPSWVCPSTPAPDSAWAVGIVAAGLVDAGQAHGSRLSSRYSTAPGLIAQQPSPRQASSPSRAASNAITSPARESANDHPSVPVSTSPARSTAER